MVNPDWLVNLSMAQAHLGNNGLSDHCPVIINTGCSVPKTRKPFQFFNFLTKLDGDFDLVRSNWSVQLNGNPLFILSEKLEG